MNFRRKSCEACRIAKRRCDLRYPVCSRCTQRCLSCNYKNQPRDSLLDGSSPTNGSSELTFSVSERNRNLMEDVFSVPSESSAIDVGDLSVFGSLPLTIDDWTFEPGFESRTSLYLPEIDPAQPKKSDLETWRYLVQEMKTYPTVFVRLGHLPFINMRLVKNPIPKATRIIFTACATYVSKTTTNEELVYETIDCAAWELSQLQSSPTLRDHIVLVQALLLLQIMRLFDGDIRQRTLGEEGEKYLEKCTRQLCILQDEEVADWQLQEIARRTVMASYLLRAVYSMLKMGRCEVLTTLSQLKMFVAKPLPAVRWNSSQEQVDGTLLTYEEYVNRWDRGLVTEIEPFERLLLVACHGKHIVDERHPHLRNLSSEE